MKSTLKRGPKEPEIVGMEAIEISVATGAIQVRAASWRGEAPQGPQPRQWRRLGCTWSRGRPASVSGVGEDPGEGRWAAASRRTRCYSPWGIPRAGSRKALERKARAKRPLRGDGVLRMLANWFPLTRLVTRTKESTDYASSGVANPDAQ